MDVVLGYVTAPDAECAARLAHLLVEQKLAACVNVLPAVSSVYGWNGEIHHDAEAILLIKTTVSSQDGVIEALRAAHPYECPAIVFYPSSGGFPPYLEWVAGQTTRTT